MNVCVHTSLQTPSQGTHVEVRGQLGEAGSLLHNIGPKDRTQVFSLGSKHF